ncbi:hypothetical protein ACFLYX_02160 [Chloroflexota bacterium]
MLRGYHKGALDRVAIEEEELAIGFDIPEVLELPISFAIKRLAW